MSGQCDIFLPAKNFRDNVARVRCFNNSLRCVKRSVCCVNFLTVLTTGYADAEKVQLMVANQAVEDYCFSKILMYVPDLKSDTDRLSDAIDLLRLPVGQCLNDRMFLQMCIVTSFPQRTSVDRFKLPEKIYLI